MSRIIVITGAGVGLGRALARSFAADGNMVVLLGRTAAKVEATAAEIGDRALAIGCDVSSPDSVRAAFAKIAEHFPKIDVLINNAAVYEPFTVAEATDGQIAKIIATNLNGPIYCARAAIAMMEGGGHIINVSSESVEVPFAHLSLYQCSKAGLENFSASLMRELQPSGIRVTCVRAGQMMEEGKSWDIDPAVAMRFAQANMAAGINLRERPISQFASVVPVFQALIDLPADVQVGRVAVQARAAS